MGSELRVPEEYRCLGCDDHRCLLEVTYKKLDYSDFESAKKLAPLVWEFNYRVNDTDLSEWTTVKVYGVDLPMQKIESHMAVCKYQQCEFVMALKGDDCVGFIMYHHFAGAVIYVRGIYLDPKVEGHGIGSGLVDNIPGAVNLVVFQTQKKLPPMRLLRGRNQRKICEDEKMITWTMDWEKSK